MNLFKTLRSSVSGLALLLACAGVARAVPTVSLDPVTQNIPVGGTALVNLNISGIDATTSLGGWLAYIAYNGTILSPTAVSFGTNLDLGVFGSLQFSDLSTGGLVKADETSFEDGAALTAAQPAAFRLATLSFGGLTAGVSTLTFGRLELSDELGFPMRYTATTASITVGNVTTVPEGGTLLVPLLGCLLLLLRASRHRACPLT